jgi:hypothetical protein
MPALHFNAASALGLIQRISENSATIAGQGERSAEQAAMVLNSLVILYCKNAKPPSVMQAEMKASMQELFQLVENSSAYNPNSFASQMRAFHTLVRRSEASAAPQPQTDFR